jgi:biotin-dependent carboxylase-like uncharacterized protein
VIEIVSMAGLATVQDGGRPGRMHEGIPPGGALSPSLLARANLAARNSTGEAAIELFGQMSIKAQSPLFVATDEGAGRWLGIGDRWAIASGPRRVRYVAVRGGIDVPYVLGGRGTLLVAGFGGHEGRPLRKGDALAAGRAVEVVEPVPDPPDPDAAIRLEPGPDPERFGPFALEALLTSTFEVSARSDRVGLRLHGCALARADGDADVSGPMVRGAIQVPASGEPIVLGPDHPTTGGYPVVATVVARDVGDLMARPVGAPVRFKLRATE